MRIVAKTITKFSSVLGAVSMVTCFAMMLIMTADVVARFILKSSILGTFEITENLLVIVVAFSFAITQIEKRHIRVDVLTDIMPYRLQNTIDVICMIISAAFIGICTYAQYTQTVAVKHTGIATTVLKIGLWPFNLCLTVGMTVFFIVICMNCISDIFNVIRKRDEVEAVKEFTDRL
jgi:TRAP-type C4-dicarboxylate transport system permease small subunit